MVAVDEVLVELVDEGVPLDEVLVDEVLPADEVLVVVVWRRRSAALG